MGGYRWEPVMDVKHRASEEAVEELLDVPETGTLMLEYNGSSGNARPSSSVYKLFSGRNVSLFINLIFATALLCCIPIISSRHCECSSDIERYYYYSPALEATKPGSHITQFNHTPWSPYNPDSGYPLEYIDGNWTNLLRMGMMGLTEQELIRAGVSPDRAVQLPPESGGGYMAYLASHHHLHCLYLLHQSLHADYYSNRSVVWLEMLDPKRRLSHFDHCVEALRQYVICNADTTVVTHQWYEGYPLPVATQENPRRCVDWDAHWEWQKSRQVPAPTAPIAKPPDVIQQPVTPKKPPPGSLGIYINVNT